MVIAKKYLYQFIYQIVILLLLAIPQLVTGQNISLKASSQSQVDVGEQFQIVYELNAEGSGFKNPDFGGLRVLTGPMSSTSSSVQIINGQVSKSFTQSYTYIVVASQAGTISVSPASVIVNGKQYISNKLSIIVQVANQSNATQGSSGSKSGTTTVNSSNDKDVYLRAITDKKNIIQGEQIIVTYRIYTRVPISGVNVSKLSAFTGFWMKNLLDENAPLKQTTERINGDEYVVADIRKVALFPQQSGKLTIEPMELECIAQLQTTSEKKRSRDPFESFFNDPFFNRNVQNVQKRLVSEALQITVNPLPVSGQTVDFKGAVGQFGLQSAIDRTNVKSNEAVNISFTITGTGNLELIDFPRPVFPPDFEVYEPKTSSQIKTTASGIAGSRKFEYLFIPRVHGDFKIPAVDFTYFDPNKKAYVSLHSDDFALHVEKGTNDESKDAVYAAGQEGIRYLGSDIHHIKTGNLYITKKGDFFFGSTMYLLTIFFAFVFFGLAIYFTKKQDKLNANQSLVRYRKATKIARNRLKAAFSLMKQKTQNEFYNEMSQALWGYIADKFMISRADLSIDSVKNALVEKETPEELVEQFVETLNKCEYARFAPGDAGKKMEELYQLGIEVITKAERLIK